MLTLMRSRKNYYRWCFVTEIKINMGKLFLIGPSNPVRRYLGDPSLSDQFLLISFRQPLGQYDGVSSHHVFADNLLNVLKTKTSETETKANKDFQMSLPMT